MLSDSQTSINTFAYDEAISEASVEFDKPKVTVPAAVGGIPGCKQVQVTITLPDGFDEDHFVEGFISLTPDDNSPDLVSPFMGYYGDWSNLPIIDAPIWSPNSIIGSTSLLFNYFDNYNLLGCTNDSYGNLIVDPEAIGISPDGDGYKDSAIPALYLLRNAKHLDVDILDENLNVVREIRSYTDLSKNILAIDNGAPVFYDLAAWDGTLYDCVSGQYEAAPEGQYYMEINSSIDFEGASTQTLMMPVKVDLTAPQINILSGINTNNSSYTLTYTLKDDGTSISPSGTFAVLNGEQSFMEPDISVDDHGVFSCPLTLKEGINEIDIGAMDNTGNYSESTLYVTLKSKAFTINFDNLSPGLNIPSDEVVDGIYTVTGDVNYDHLNKLQLNGIDAEINEDLSFSVPLSLDSGFKDKVHVYVEDNSGTVLADYYIPAYYDTGAPVIDLTLPIQADDGNIYTNQDNLTLAGTVSDSYPFKFYVNDDEILYHSKGDGTEVATELFHIPDLPVTDGSIIELKAVDESAEKNERIQTINVKVDKEAPEITIEGVEDGGTYTNKATPKVTVKDNSHCTSTITLDGNDYNNGSAVSSPGEHKLSVTAQDLAGNKAEKELSFTIKKVNVIVPSAPSDTTPPTVVTKSGNIKLGESLVVEFSENVQKSDNYEAITVTGSKGKSIISAKSLSGSMLSLSPQGSLQYGESYTVTIPSGAVIDFEGNKLINGASVVFATERQDTNAFYRLSGNDRYETCVETVQEGWETSDYAVLVTGESYPDALSAAPLAKKYDAPILITESLALTPVIEAEIARLKVKNLFIIGGEGAVSKDIENLLSDKYDIGCVRIAGSDRYETSARVAEYLDASHGAVIASGDGYADALSMASYAAAKGMPILLVEKNSIPESISKYITDKNVNKTYVVGGLGVISEEVEKLLPNPTRYAGDDRYGTNAKVVKGLSGEFNFDIVYITTGEDFADALSGAVLAAKTGSPIILVSDNMSPETIRMIKEIVSAAKSKYILGGEASVGTYTLDRLLQ